LEASSLKAPPGATDDRAMALIIGMAALHWPSAGSERIIDAYIEAQDPMYEVDAGSYR